MEQSEGDAPGRLRVVQHLVLAVVAYLPLLLTARGQVAADTKTYLYLEPSRLLSRAPWMWDPNTGFGTVSHQTIGYLFPMGPWFWFFDRLGAPDWLAQRLWHATILFTAGAGVLFLLRTLRPDGWTRPTAAAALAAALVFMLTPYSLQYASRLSALLLPWAALPWLVGLTQRALRRGGWRHPAVFAIVATTVGSVNATALVLIAPGPLLWIAFSVWVHREVTLREAAKTVARIGVLSSLCALWWVTGLLVQGGYGLNVLRYSETVATVASKSTASEVLRGLGYWFFYGGDKLGAWIEQAPRYRGVLWLLAATYAVPALAFVSAAIARWRYRSFAIAMIAVGTALSVGAYPYEHPAPLGALFKLFAESSSAGLAMRSTPRAVPLVILGLAMAVFTGLAAIGRRWPQRALTGSALVAVMALVAMQPLWSGQYLSGNLLRDEELPQYWQDAATYLDDQPRDNRVLELPGMDFAAYRWGQTVDPITPGLIDRPYAARELIPQGSAGSADLLNALDRRLQEGVFDRRALAPIARLMGVGDIVLRSDLEYERFGIARPRQTWALFLPAPPGLGAPATFGLSEPSDTGARLPVDDELELVTPPSIPNPPPVAIFPVVDSTPIVWTAATSRPVVVAGDGDGLIHAAEAGLIDGLSPVLYSAALADRPALLAAAIDDGAHLVITDSNRRRARYWRGVLESFGYTEPRGSTPLRHDPADNRLPVFPDAGEDSFTAARHEGVREVRTTSHGNPTNRGANAFDGDTETAWRAGEFANVHGERIEVELEEPIAPSSVEVVQPLTGSINRYITKVEVQLDGEAVGTFTLDASSRRGVGQRLPLDGRKFRRLGLEVVDDNFGELDSYRGKSPVGFAEIRIPGVRFEEIIDLPRDLLSAGNEASKDNPLTVLMERARFNPLLTSHRDEEPGMVRGFSLPTEREFSLRGEARLSAFAPPHLVDGLMGIRGANAGGITINTSSSLHGSVAHRGSAAIDGNVATSWTTGFQEGNVKGASIDLELPSPVRFGQLDLVVVADGRHSVPTRLRVEVGNERRVVELPAVPDAEDAGATTKIPVSFAPLEGSRIRVVIESVRAVTALNYRDGVAEMRPAAIAELGIPGLVRPREFFSFDSGCRSDLLQLDGKPIDIRITGPLSDAEARLPLTIATCGWKRLSIGAGEHVLRAEKGRLRGIDIDSLVLESRGAVSGSTAASSPAPRVDVDAEGRTSYDLRVAHDGEPFWLVLKQSRSEGWRATADGIGSLGEPVLINGFANGWLIDPDDATDLRVHLRWAPQRTVWFSLAVSGIAMPACLVIALWPTIRRRRDGAKSFAAEPELTSPLSYRYVRPSVKRVARCAGICGLIALLLAGFWVAVGVLVAVVVAIVTGRRGRALLAGGAGLAVAASGAIVFGNVLVDGVPLPLFELPGYFATAHVLAWVGVLFLVSDALAGWFTRDRGDGQPLP